MNFCSIDEAWGKSHQNYISKNFKDSTEEDCISTSSIESIEIKTKNKKKDKKKYIPTETLTMSDSSLIETFTESIKDKKNCGRLVNHIMKCKKCRDKLRAKFRPPLVSKLNNLFDDNKDIFVLILIGFAILIFFKLMYSLC
tara:strand:+ start:1001 stop:1423 length:423 start_codon:yes stop_codon:yes gene_type:complete